ncbi:MAG: metalloregulator ArsR/SmtB family transcription factor [Octadecabacter sp.]|jgi:ArsR family transcriptional regulator, arsenate/arsenite/antimonite-responsive transcriptional repressor
MDQNSAIDVFSALAQPTRIAVFRLLVQVGPAGLPALEISRRLEVVPSTLSGHLAILKRAGILTATRHQREIHYAANLGAVNELIAFLLADCCNGQIGNCGNILSLLDLGRLQDGNVPEILEHPKKAG